MYIEKDKALNLIKTHLNELLRTIKGKLDFLSQLSKGDDDWSFIIKAHSLIEAVVSELLTTHLGEAKLNNFFERLPLSDLKTGKIAVAKELSLINKNQLRFIQYLSELRNTLVHQIKNIEFDMKEHFTKANKSQRNSWCEKILWYEMEETTKQNWKKITLNTPRTSIYNSIFLLITDCFVKIATKKALQEIDELSDDTLEKLLDSINIKEIVKTHNQQIAPE